MANNLWQRFRELLPSDPLLIGTVLSHNADGTSTVELPGGGQLRVMGQGVAVAAKAFIQGGRIVEQAPDLPVTEIEV